MLHTSGPAESSKSMTLLSGKRQIITVKTERDLRDRRHAEKLCSLTYGASRNYAVTTCNEGQPRALETACSKGGRECKRYQDDTQLLAATRRPHRQLLLNLSFFSENFIGACGERTQQKLYNTCAGLMQNRVQPPRLCRRSRSIVS